MDRLIIANWNSRGLRNKVVELSIFLTENKIDIACITETHLKTLQFTDATASIGGGVAIIIRKSIRHRAINVLPNKNTNQIIGLEVFTSNIPIKIMCLYIPPQEKQDLSYLRSIFNNNAPTIIAGDLNAKDLAWGC